MIQVFSLTLGADLLKEQQVSVSIYRGDLEDKAAPGNKRHKLKYNIAQAKKQGARYLVSFGGPYSNHLHALANTCSGTDLTPIAIVRGELQPQLTPTLRDFVTQGGLLWPSQRLDYKLGQDSLVAKEIQKKFPTAYWVPEGGSNALGVLGCYDWAWHIVQQQKTPFDAWAVSVGTGATCAGLLSHPQSPHILAFPALKQGKDLQPAIESMALQSNSASALDKLTIIDEYHHGGYAKFPTELKDYVSAIHALNPSVKLDPVYTAKVVYGLEQEIKKGRLKNKKILIIHTGGLQGWSGFK